MKLIHSGRAVFAAAAIAAVALLATSTAQADNFTVKQVDGATKTMCSTTVSGVEHGCHVIEGLNAGAPIKLRAASNGDLNVDVDQLPATLGAKTSAASLSIVPASDAAFAITGAQLPASLGSKTSAASLSIAPASDATFSFSGLQLPPSLGVKTSAASLSMAPASDAVFTMTSTQLASILTAVQAATPAGANPIGMVGANTFTAKTATGTFTRQANTTAYGVNTSLCGASCTGMLVPVARSTGGTGKIYKASVYTSATAVGQTVRLHIYDACPATIPADGAAFTSSGVATEFGSLEVVVTQAYTDGARGWGIPTSGNFVEFKAPAGLTSVCVLAEAKTAFTPSSAAVYTIGLSGDAD